MARLSIIIPTLNEATTLARTLRREPCIRPPGRAWEGAYNRGNALTPPRGPGHSMNQGARQATGDLLCFLHADTLIPDDLVSVAERTSRMPRLPAPASSP